MTNAIRGGFSILAIVLLSTVAAAAEDGWRLRMIDGTGLGDANNAGIGRMVAHEDWFYLGTWNTQAGTIIYRSRDGETWEKISEPGIHGGAADFTVAGFVWYGDHLYAGTWNQQKGAAMYRGNADAPNAADITWETVATGGLGNPRNWGFTHLRPFNGHLYAGCFNFIEGTEAFRSATGDAGSWTMVIPKAWNSKVNTDSTFMLVYDDYLYLGTECARDPQFTEGTQLWRTDGNVAPPFDQWQQVNVNGFGNARNHNICGLAELGGKIYAGTWNETQGLEVWRATPGDAVPFADWERVGENVFNNPADWFTTCMVTLGDKLFISTVGAFTSDPAMYFLPNVKTVSAHGGRLAKTDGKTWQEIDAPGFMDFPYIGIQWLATFQDKLYIGGQAFDHPAQLWVYEKE